MEAKTELTNRVLPDRLDTSMVLATTVLANRVDTSNKLFNVNVLNVPVEAKMELTNRVLPDKVDTLMVLPERDSKVTEPVEITGELNNEVTKDVLAVIVEVSMVLVAILLVTIALVVIEEITVVLIKSELA